MINNNIINHKRYGEGIFGHKLEELIGAGNTDGNYDNLTDGLRNSYIEHDLQIVYRFTRFLEDTPVLIPGNTPRKIKQDLNNQYCQLRFQETYNITAQDPTLYSEIAILEHMAMRSMGDDKFQTVGAMTIHQFSNATNADPSHHYALISQSEYERALPTVWCMGSLEEGHQPLLPFVKSGDIVTIPRSFEKTINIGDYTFFATNSVVKPLTIHHDAIKYLYDGGLLPINGKIMHLTEVERTEHFSVLKCLEKATKIHTLMWTEQKEDITLTLPLPDHMSTAGEFSYLNIVNREIKIDIKLIKKLINFNLGTIKSPSANNQAAVAFYNGTSYVNEIKKRAHAQDPTFLNVHAALARAMSIDMERRINIGESTSKFMQSMSVFGPLVATGVNRLIGLISDNLLTMLKTKYTQVPLDLLNLLTNVTSNDFFSGGGSGGKKYDSISTLIKMVEGKDCYESHSPLGQQVPETSAKACYHHQKCTGHIATHDAEDVCLCCGIHTTNLFCSCCDVLRIRREGEDKSVKMLGRMFKEHRSLEELLIIASEKRTDGVLNDPLPMENFKETEREMYIRLNKLRQDRQINPIPYTYDENIAEEAKKAKASKKIMMKKKPSMTELRQSVVTRQNKSSEGSAQGTLLSAFDDELFSYNKAAQKAASSSVQLIQPSLKETKVVSTDRPERKSEKNPHKLMDYMLRLLPAQVLALVQDEVGTLNTMTARLGNSMMPVIPYINMLKGDLPSQHAGISKWRYTTIADPLLNTAYNACGFETIRYYYNTWDLNVTFTLEYMLGYLKLANIPDGGFDVQEMSDMCCHLANVFKKNFMLTTSRGQIVLIRGDPDSIAFHSCVLTSTGGSKDEPNIGHWFPAVVWFESAPTFYYYLAENILDEDRAQMASSYNITDTTFGRDPATISQAIECECKLIMKTGTHLRFNTIDGQPEFKKILGSYFYTNNDNMIHDYVIGAVSIRVGDWVEEMAPICLSGVAGIDAYFAKHRADEADTYDTDLGQLQKTQFLLNYKQLKLNSVKFMEARGLDPNYNEFQVKVVACKSRNFYRVEMLTKYSKIKTMDLVKFAGRKYPYARVVGIVTNGFNVYSNCDISGSNTMYTMKQSLGSAERAFTRAMMDGKWNKAKLDAIIPNCIIYGGVPGCGKTYNEVKSSGKGTLILYRTVGGKESIMREIKVQQRQAIALMSYEKFFNMDTTMYKKIIVDEAFSLSATEACSLLIRCQEQQQWVEFYGDPNQIGSIVDHEIVGLRYNSNIHEFFPNMTYSYDNKTRRFGPNLCHMLKQVGYNIESIAKHDTEVIIKRCATLDDGVLVSLHHEHHPQLILSCYNDTIKTVAQLITDTICKMTTVHSSQGDEADCVLFILKSSNRNHDELLRNRRYLYSGISRCKTKVILLLVNLIARIDDLTEIFPNRGAAGDSNLTRVHAKDMHLYSDKELKQFEMRLKKPHSQIESMKISREGNKTSISTNLKFNMGQATIHNIDGTLTVEGTPWLVNIVNSNLERGLVLRSDEHVEFCVRITMESWVKITKLLKYVSTFAFNDDLYGKPWCEMWIANECYHVVMKPGCALMTGFEVYRKDGVLLLSVSSAYKNPFTRRITILQESKTTKLIRSVWDNGMMKLITVNAIAMRILNDLNMHCDAECDAIPPPTFIANFTTGLDKFAKLLLRRCNSIKNKCTLIGSCGYCGECVNYGRKSAAYFKSMCPSKNHSYLEVDRYEPISMVSYSDVQYDTSIMTKLRKAISKTAVSLARMFSYNVEDQITTSDSIEPLELMPDDDVTQENRLKIWDRKPSMIKCLNLDNVPLGEFRCDDDTSICLYIEQLCAMDEGKVKATEGFGGLLHIRLPLHIANGTKVGKLWEQRAQQALLNVVKKGAKDIAIPDGTPDDLKIDLKEDLGGRDMMIVGNYHGNRGIRLALECISVVSVFGRGQGTHCLYRGNFPLACQLQEIWYCDMLGLFVNDIEEAEWDYQMATWRNKKRDFINRTKPFENTIDDGKQNVVFYGFNLIKRNKTEISNLLHDLPFHDHVFLMPHSLNNSNKYYQYVEDEDDPDVMYLKIRGEKTVITVDKEIVSKAGMGFNVILSTGKHLTFTKLMSLAGFDLFCVKEEEPVLYSVGLPLADTYLDVKIKITVPTVVTSVQELLCTKKLFVIRTGYVSQRLLKSLVMRGMMEQMSVRQMATYARNVNFMNVITNNKQFASFDEDIHAVNLACLAAAQICSNYHNQAEKIINLWEYYRLHPETADILESVLYPLLQVVICVDFQHICQGIVDVLKTLYLEIDTGCTTEELDFYYQNMQVHIRPANHTFIVRRYEVNKIQHAASSKGLFTNTGNNGSGDQTDDFIKEKAENHTTLETTHSDNEHCSQNIMLSLKKKNTTATSGVSEPSYARANEKQTSAEENTLSHTDIMLQRSGIRVVVPRRATRKLDFTSNSSDTQNTTSKPVIISNNGNKPTPVIGEAPNIKGDKPPPIDTLTSYGSSKAIGKKKESIVDTIKHSPDNKFSGVMEGDFNMYLMVCKHFHNACVEHHHNMKEFLDALRRMNPLSFRCIQELAKKNKITINAMFMKCNNAEFQPKLKSEKQRSHKSSKLETLENEQETKSIDRVELSNNGLESTGLTTTIELVVDDLGTIDQGDDVIIIDDAVDTDGMEIELLPDDKITSELNQLGLSHHDDGQDESTVKNSDANLVVSVSSGIQKPEFLLQQSQLREFDNTMFIETQKEKEKEKERSVDSINIMNFETGIEEMCTTTQNFRKNKLKKKKYNFEEFQKQLDREIALQGLEDKPKLNIGSSIPIVNVKVGNQLAKTLSPSVIRPFIEAADSILIEKEKNKTIIDLSNEKIEMAEEASAIVLKDIPTREKTTRRLTQLLVAVGTTGDSEPQMKLANLCVGYGDGIDIIIHPDTKHNVPRHMNVIEMSISAEALASEFVKLGSGPLGLAAGLKLQVKSSTALLESLKKIKSNVKYNGVLPFYTTTAVSFCKSKEFNYIKVHTIPLATTMDKTREGTMHKMKKFLSDRLDLPKLIAGSMQMMDLWAGTNASVSDMKAVHMWDPSDFNVVMFNESLSGPTVVEFDKTKTTFIGCQLLQSPSYSTPLVDKWLKMKKFDRLCVIALGSMPISEFEAEVDAMVCGCFSVNMVVLLNAYVIGKKKNHITIKGEKIDLTKEGVYFDGSLFLSKKLNYNTTMKQASIVIHAGGAGSCHQLASFKVPAIIAWAGGDQDAWADLMEKNNFGVQISLHKVTTVTFQKTLTKLLKNLGEISNDLCKLNGKIRVDWSEINRTVKAMGHQLMNYDHEIPYQNFSYIHKGYETLLSKNQRFIGTFMSQGELLFSPDTNDTTGGCVQECLKYLGADMEKLLTTYKCFNWPGLTMDQIYSLVRICELNVGVANDRYCFSIIKQHPSINSKPSDNKVLRVVRLGEINHCTVVSVQIDWKPTPLESSGMSDFQAIQFLNKLMEDGQTSIEMTLQEASNSLEVMDDTNNTCYNNVLNSVKWLDIDVFIKREACIVSMLTHNSSRTGWTTIIAVDLDETEYNNTLAIGLGPNVRELLGVLTDGISTILIGNAGKFASISCVVFTKRPWLRAAKWELESRFFEEKTLICANESSYRELRNSQYGINGVSMIDMEKDISNGILYTYFNTDNAEDEKTHFLLETCGHLMSSAPIRLNKLVINKLTSTHRDPTKFILYKGLLQTAHHFGADEDVIILKKNRLSKNYACCGCMVIQFTRTENEDLLKVLLDNSLESKNRYYKLETYTEKRKLSWKVFKGKHPASWPDVGTNSMTVKVTKLAEENLVWKDWVRCDRFWYRVRDLTIIDFAARSVIRLLSTGGAQALTEVTVPAVATGGFQTQNWVIKEPSKGSDANIEEFLLQGFSEGEKNAVALNSMLYENNLFYHEFDELVFKGKAPVEMYCVLPASWTLEDGSFKQIAIPQPESILFFEHDENTEVIVKSPKGDWPYPIKMKLIPGGFKVTKVIKLEQYPDRARPIFTRGITSEVNVVTQRIGSRMTYITKTWSAKEMNSLTFRVYFHSQAMDLINKYRNNPLVITPSGVKNWLESRTDPDRVKAIYEKWCDGEMAFKNLNFVKMHLKQESLLKKEPAQSMEATLCRPIIWQPKYICAFLGDVFGEAKKRLKYLLRDNYIYTDGCDVVALAAKLKTFPPATCFFTNDLEKQDRQTCGPLIDAEMEFYSCTGVSNEIISYHREMHHNWNAQGTYVRFDGNEQRLTGQITTSLGNVYVNLTVHAQFFADNEHIISFALFLGDDMLVGMTAVPYVGRLKRDIKENFNMVCKPNINLKVGDFCCMLVTLDDNGQNALVPDYHRLRSRFAIPNGEGDCSSIEKHLVRVMSYLTLINPGGDVDELCRSRGIMNTTRAYYDEHVALRATALQYNQTIEWAESQRRELIQLMGSEPIIQEFKLFHAGKF